MPSLYPYITAMSGSRAVPTPSMDGVIFIFGSDFWELTFKNNGEFVKKNNNVKRQQEYANLILFQVKFKDGN